MCFLCYTSNHSLTVLKWNFCTICITSYIFNGINDILQWYFCIMWHAKATLLVPFPDCVRYIKVCRIDQGLAQCVVNVPWLDVGGAKSSDQKTAADKKRRRMSKEPTEHGIFTLSNWMIYGEGIICWLIHGSYDSNRQGAQYRYRKKQFEHGDTYSAHGP